MVRKGLQILVLGLIGISAYSQPYQGVATHFEALGTPYGGCGVPPELVETDNYVALNVYASPGVGTMWTRPLKGADTVHMGMFANGTNCGRWLKVTIGEDCIDGTNDGALGQQFCRGANAKWLNDKYSGATLYMIVTDACGDNNGWCRDSKFHLDLHTPSLNKFEQNGVPINDMLPLHFNNRKINWEFVEAPNYSGDIDIYFLQKAQYYWPAIMINHLRNGISRVEQKINGKWVTIDRNSDMGQAFLLKDFTQPYTIRAYDIYGNLINGGREYTMSLPANCNNGCPDPSTKTTFAAKDSIYSQQIQLKAGWNLISFNVSPINKTIESVFKNVLGNIKEIKTVNGFWETSQNALLNSLKSVSDGEAYMVFAQSSCTLNTSGTIVFNQQLKSIKQGWNMVGCPFQANKTFSSSINLNAIETIKDFDGFWNGSTANQLIMMEPGKGYFVKGK